MNILRFVHQDKVVTPIPDTLADLHTHNDQVYVLIVLLGFFIFYY